MHIDWEACDSNGSPLTAYEVEISDGKATGQWSQTYAGLNMMHDVYGLSPFTRVSFR